MSAGVIPKACNPANKRLSDAPIPVSKRICIPLLSIKNVLMEEGIPFSSESFFIKSSPASGKSEGGISFAEALSM